MNPSPTIPDLNDLELIRFIHSKRIQPQEVLDEARNELISRGLTREVIQELKAIIEKEEAEELRQRVIAIYGVDHSNEPRWVKRFINSVFYFFGCLSLLKAFESIGIIRDLLHSSRYWDALIFKDLGILLLLAIGVWQFYHRKKSGWVLMLVFLSYSVPMRIYDIFELHDYIRASGHLMPYVFMMVSPVIVLVLHLSVFTVVGYVLMGETLRELFKSDVRLGVKCISYGVLLAILNVIIQVGLNFA